MRYFKSIALSLLFVNLVFGSMLWGRDDCKILYQEDFEDRVADGWIEETSCRWSIVCDEGDWSYFLNTTCYERGEVSVLVTHTFSDFTLSTLIHKFSDVFLRTFRQDNRINKINIILFINNVIELINFLAIL